MDYIRARKGEVMKASPFRALWILPYFSGIDPVQVFHSGGHILPQKI